MIGRLFSLSDSTYWLFNSCQRIEEFKYRSFVGVQGKMTCIIEVVQLFLVCVFQMNTDEQKEEKRQKIGSFFLYIAKQKWQLKWDDVGSRLEIPERNVY